VRARLLQVVLIPPVGGSANSPLSTAVISMQNTSFEKLETCTLHWIVCTRSRDCTKQINRHIIKKNSPRIQRYPMNGFSRAGHLCVYNVLTCIGSFSLTNSLHCQVFLLLSLVTFRACNRKAFQIRILRLHMFIQRYSQYKYMYNPDA
jgi:hypothetical protein